MSLATRHLLSLAVLGGLCFAGPALADPQHGQPVTPTPHQVVAERVSVVRVAVDDAQALLDQLQRLAAARPPAESARGERPEGSISRLIRLDVPTVVNRGSRFVFRDATPRGPQAVEAPGARRSKSERHEAVERFRQALAKERRAKGTRR